MTVGIPGVEGDWIKIELLGARRIVSIDYATNAVTLEAERCWSAGARVFCCESDRFKECPDIGAHESAALQS